MPRALGALVVLALAASPGCRTPSGSGEAAPAAPSELKAEPRGDGGGGAVTTSSLGPGDLIEIRVFQEADLSGMWRLASDGKIDYPLCGPVSLQGLNQTQAAGVLQRCLSAGFLKRPQVSVVTREYNSKKIFVFGEVNKPGTFPYEDNMNIVQAITLAGGFTKLAAKNSTSVTRLVEGQEKKVPVRVHDIGNGRERNFALQPGDIVFVPESFF